MTSHENALSDTHDFYNFEVDLNTYPRIKYQPHGYYDGIQENTVITIGDLHGNAQKLMYFLIYNEIISISPLEYETFINIYKRSPYRLNAIDITQFNQIINNAKVNPKYKLKFLGDDLCDRGMNDYYTLQIFKKLDESNVSFDIVLSNHNFLFIKTFETIFQDFSENPYQNSLYDSFFKSMLNLGKIIERGLINKKDITSIIENNYLKHIVLVGVESDYKNNAITLYTHAPIDIQILANLSDELNIVFDDTSVSILTATLNKMNKKVSDFIMSHTFTYYYRYLEKQHTLFNSLNPLYQMLWNRDYSILNRTYQPKSIYPPNWYEYNVNYIHGHDPQVQLFNSHIYNLDNILGHGEYNDIGLFSFHALLKNEQ